MALSPSARVLRALVSMCVLVPLFAFASGSAGTDARVIWLTLPGGVLKVSPADGTVSSQLPALNQPGALAVEGADDTVWVYGQKAIVAFDHLGNTLLTVNLPANFHGGTPEGMAVDNAAGNIWIAIQKDLYRVDMGGTLKADYPLAGNAVALSLDADDSQVWVAEQQGIEVFDASGARQLKFAPSSAVTALAYDASLHETWVLGAGTVSRYSNAGQQSFQAALGADLGNFIAPDGQGGAWVAGTQNLAYVAASGQSQFVIQPFAGLSGAAILGLVADAVDHSAWVANSLHLRHYDTTGDFLLEAALPAGPGNGNGVQQLGYYVDTIPPTVSITAPQDGLWTNHNQPVIALSYSDNTGVDPTSIKLTANDQPLVVSCKPATDGSGATCTPDSALQDGGYSLAATVADYAGNVSKPATVSFHVLTVPPTITVTSPSGPYTNQPNFTVTGSVDQPGTLTINGANVPLINGSFSTTVSLVQGDNTLTFVATDLADNVTTITKTINLNTIPPIPVVNGDITVTGPTDGKVTITGKAGAAAPGVSVTITDAQTGQSVTVIAGADGAFTATLAASSNDSLQISETDQWGNVTTDPTAIAVSNLPPDPASVAPAFTTTSYTTFADQTSFLYSGDNPIQAGVSPGTMQAYRVAVIRGRVVDIDGKPLPGVAITALNHPEYGQTLSRTDGMFDYAVNGGGLITLNYALKGSLSSQRNVTVPWRDYVRVKDVVLLQPDAQVTPVAFGAASMQVAQGSVQTDKDGSRQATVLFPTGTTATMLMPDGSTQALTGGSFRATEYTVGPQGQNAMPAALPPTSGYTYAVNLSFDEAVAAGAKSVLFNQPVPVYVDNFLGFPAGEIVPVGWYDPTLGSWVGQDNGLVIKILSIDPSGAAVLDVDGKGVAATSTELTTLGITAEELATLGKQYAAGKSLWRATLKHFSSIDFNWPVGPVPFNAQGPGNIQVPPPKPNVPGCNCNTKPGSEINAQNQSTGEDIPVAGESFALHYRSDRTPGSRAVNSITVPLIGATVPQGLQGIELEVSIAGEYVDLFFPPTPNQHYVYTWDGKDGYGRPIYGTEDAFVRLGYLYNYRYYTPDESSAWASMPHNNTGGDDTSAIHGRIYYTLLNQYIVPITGVPLPPKQFGNGWSIDIQHAYEVQSRTLLQGDGSDRHAWAVNETVQRFAGGGGTTLALTTPLPAPAKNFYLPFTDITVDSAGDIYGISEYSQVGLVKIDHNGMIVAASPSPAPGGGLSSVRTDSEGRAYVLVYNPPGLTSPNNYSVYRIYRQELDGHYTLVGGNGQQCVYSGTENCGDNGPAIQAKIGFVRNMTVGPDGTIYFTQSPSGNWGGMVIRKITPDGLIKRLPFNLWDNGIGGLAVGPDGLLYYAGRATYCVWKINANGQIVRVAGSGAQVNDGNGGPALQAGMIFPLEVAFGPDGSLYVDDAGIIRHIGNDKIITQFAGSGTNWAAGVGEAATSIRFGGPWTVGPDGALVFQDIYANAPGRDAVMRIDNSMPSFNVTQTAIPSTDGNDLYLFDDTGRQLKTIDSITQATIYSFGYDSQGALSSITDSVGRITTFQRDAADNLSAIVSPDGQKTSVTVDANLNLTAIADPAGDTFKMQYTTDGLMTGFTDPRGNLDTMQFDELGRFTKNVNAVGGGWTVNRVDSPNSYTVTMRSAEGRNYSYYVGNNTDTSRQLTETAPDGTQTQQTFFSSGQQTTTTADGSLITTMAAADPRLGMQASYLASESAKTPSGLTFNVTRSRSAPLSDPANSFSFTSLSDTVTVNGQNYVFAFAPTSKTWTTTSPVGRKAVTVVDSLDRPVSVQFGGLNAVDYSYDAAGHLQTISSGSGTAMRTIQYTYYADGPSRGYLQQVQDAMGRTVGYQYDKAGRVTLETLPDGNQIGFSYDANGNLASLTPPSRPAHGFDYDGIDEVQDYTPPTVTGVTTPATHYDYNLDRQLTAVTLPDGQQISLGYDTGGRLGTVTLPTGLYTYAYKPVTGQIQSIAAPNAQDLAYTWDGSLNTGSTWSGPVTGSVTRSFDKNFRVTNLSVNGAAIAYGYDNDGLITSAGSETLKRDAGDGLITGTTLDTVSTTETYDNFGAPLTDAASAGSTALYSVTYARDNVGRITGKTEIINGISHSYGYDYDQQGRLDSATLDGTTTTYGYDANGNRTQVNGATVASYDDQDRLSTYGAARYTYTANGALLTKTDATGTTDYTYDVLGNLLEVKLPNGTDIQYIVDGQNRRVGKQVNGTLVQGFLYQNQLAPVAELDGSGNVIQRYVYGSHANVPDYIIQGSNTYRVITDQLGSPRLIVDTTSGTVVEQIDYDAWGNVANDTNPGLQPFGFAGGIYDRDTSMYHFGARDYDPQSGRWTAKDPILFAGGETSLFGYASNDPVNSYDPSGHEVVLGIIGAAIGAAFGAAEAAANGESEKDIFESAAAGALTGGLAGLTFGGSLLAEAAVAGGRAVASSGVEYARERLTGNHCVNISNVILAGSFGLIGDSAAASLADDAGKNLAQALGSLADGLGILTSDLFEAASENHAAGVTGY